MVEVNPSDPIRIQIKVDYCSLSIEVDTGEVVSII